MQLCVLATVDIVMERNGKQTSRGPRSCTLKMAPPAPQLCGVEWVCKSDVSLGISAVTSENYKDTVVGAVLCICLTQNSRWLGKAKTGALTINMYEHASVG